MIDILIMAVIVFGATRIYINKFDIKGKTIIAILAAVILTGFLNLIQFILKLVLDLIF